MNDIIEVIKNALGTSVTQAHYIWINRKLTTVKGHVTRKWFVKNDIHYNTEGADYWSTAILKELRQYLF